MIMYEEDIEEIIEDCAQMKYENLAEIKVMYKNCDQSQIAERDARIAEAKQDMEDLKKTRMAEAKLKMSEKKKEIS